jgi:hypothetical protein
MTTNINRSHEVIENLKLADNATESRYAYAYAFGWAWAMLTEKQRDKMLKLSQDKANEKENANA